MIPKKPIKTGPADDKVVPCDGCIISRQKDLDVNHFRNIVEELGLLEKISKAKSIVIKPNFAGGAVIPVDSHAVTDIELMRKIIDALWDINKDVHILVAESDSAGKGFGFLKFENFGLDKWELENFSLLDLSRDRLRRVELPELKFFSDKIEPLFLSETLLDADLVISLANFKTHAVTKYTGACKNFFGLLPREDKYFYHTSIDKVIHDVIRAVPPQLSIVDAFRAMEQNGPIIGKPIDLEFRIYSVSAPLADIVACYMIYINFRRVKYLKFLSKYENLPETINAPRYKVTYRVPALAFFNYVGLVIQKIGLEIFLYGHRVHSAYSFILFGMMTVRPVLLWFFDIGTLKKWKRKIFND